MAYIGLKRHLLYYRCWEIKEKRPQHTVAYLPFLPSDKIDMIECSIFRSICIFVCVSIYACQTLDGMSLTANIDSAVVAISSGAGDTGLEAMRPNA